MPSSSILPSSSASTSSSAPNFSNIGRPSRGLQRPPEAVRPVITPAAANNRPNCLVRSIGRVLLRKRSTTNTNNNNYNTNNKNICNFTNGARVVGTAQARYQRSTLDIIEDHEEKHQNGLLCQKSCSPYYRGLLSNPPDNPEQAESHAAPSTTTTAVSKASFASSFIVKIQSCLLFGGSNNEDNRFDDDGPPNAPTRLRNAIVKHVTTAAAAASPSSSSSSYYSLPSAAPSPALLMSMETRSPLMERKERCSSQKKPLRESMIPAGTAETVPNLRDDHDEPMISSLKEVDRVDHQKVFVDDQEKNNMFNIGGKREFMWADKYRPKALEGFICNRSKAIQLQDLARKGDYGHFIFEGLPGVGKRTMILAMLREAFGPDSLKASEQHKVFNVKSEVVGLGVRVPVKESPRLVEVNLSDLKGYEKHLIFQLIKETSHDLKTSNGSSVPCKPPDHCRAIIFYGVDKLSTDAILHVRWLLERVKNCTKIFFCCTDASKLQAIKDICTVVQLLPPSRTEIIEVLKFIAEKEGIDLPHQLAEKFTDTSTNNLRQAIRSFEATWLKHYPFTEDQQVLTGWEDDIASIAKNMVHEQSPKLLYIIRGKLRDLREHNVSPEFIFQSLVDELKKHLHHLLKRRVQNLYVEYNRKDDRSMFESDKAIAQMGNNNISQQFLRIEEFIAKFMSCYKAESAKIMQEDSADQNIIEA